MVGNFLGEKEKEGKGGGRGCEPVRGTSDPNRKRFGGKGKKEKVSISMARVSLEPSGGSTLDMRKTVEARTEKKLILRRHGPKTGSMLKSRLEKKKRHSPMNE